MQTLRFPEFDPAPYLDNETSIAAYFFDILEANDPALLVSTLGDIARARGLTEIAKSAGISREALYKALRPKSSSGFETISRVCAALGVRLTAQPINTTLFSNANFFLPDHSHRHKLKAWVQNPSTESDSLLTPMTICLLTFMAATQE